MAKLSCETYYEELERLTDFTYMTNDADINSMGSEDGLVTDSGIRVIVLEETKELRRTSSKVFVDPTWLHTWESEGCHKPVDTPKFFFPSIPSHSKVNALAIPYNIGNGHWTLFYVSLKHRHITFIDSLSYAGGTVEDKARNVIFKFYKVFKEHFWGRPGHELHYVADRDCFRQDDGVSCGLYIIQNLIEILNNEVPGRIGMPDDHKLVFRNLWAERLRWKKKWQENLLL
ncbi:hypothetical protein B0O99DRAFT_301045 [Bisporella sp. PMI_857]|nr:hypothetical protein B0O99DRAFT_301045 [Bisporella sp. PMI_857]